MKRGFTLIELLTVIAITAILLTIITIPVVQSFNFTRSAQAFADAQDRARVLIARLEREIGNSAGVRDNTGERGALRVVVPGLNGNPEPVTIPFAKLDLVRVAEGDPTRGPTGAFINPDTGKEDPTLQAPKGQPNLPSSPGLTIVRYWVGLRDPFTPYNNPYDGLLMTRNSRRDNLFVLFRAEVQPRVWDPAANGGQGGLVVNSQFFFDQDRDADPTTFGPLLDDQDFFNPLVAYPPYAQPRPNDPADKAAMVRNWRQRATIVTEVSRYDMLQALVDRRTNTAVYDGNVPRLATLIRFQPTRVSSEPAEGMMAVRSGEETFNAQKIGPDVFLTEFGSWANLFARIWPSEYPTSWGFGAGQQIAGNVRPQWGQTPLGTGAPYLVARPRLSPVGQTLGFSLYGYDPATAGGPDTQAGVELFDISLYRDLKGANQPYAYTRAVAAANGRSGWQAMPVWQQRFVPISPDPRGGRVFASFDVRDVGTLGGTPPVPFADNMPPAPIGDPFTPNNDPDVATGNWFDATFRSVNRRFNKLWADFGTLAPGLDRGQYVSRFVDLRVTPMPDGTQNPLAPVQGQQRASIVPGSEVVIGPDQTPGPNYGRPTRYTRVTQRPVGPNQYLINYTDQPEPNWAALGFPVPANAYDPTFYDPTNFVSAVLQPRFRAGYVELNSAFGEPLPNSVIGNILVGYRFQFTEPNDVVAVDYDSTEIIELVLTVRNYPQSNVPSPQSITLKGTAAVRNFIR